MPAKKIGIQYDFQKYEILNVRVQNLSSAPSSPVTGQQYYDTTLGKFGVWNGATWDYMGTSTASGDVSSNTAASVDGEVAVFSGTGGKTIKRATGSGLAKLTSGVLSTATSGTDYAPATSGTSILKGNGSGGFSSATSGTDYSAGTSALATGILKSTTSTGVLSIAVANDFPTLNQNTTGTASNLSGTPALPNGTTATTQTQGDNSTKLATTAYADAAVAAVLGANDAMVYKGVIDASANPNYPAASAGHAYKISVAGKIGGASGPNVEVGDLVIATADGLSAGNHATVGGSWTIIQSNIDGAVTGPASSTSGNLATFSGTTGKVLSDSGKAVPSGTIVGTSDSQALTNKDLTGTGNTFPTFNQNTTGTASNVTGTVAIANGGTGQTTALAARTALGAVGKYTGTIGNGSATSIAVTHGLGSQYVTAQVFDATSNALIECDVTLTSSTQTTFDFAVAPTTNQYRVVITG